MTPDEYIAQYEQWHFIKALKPDGMGAIIYKNGRLLVSNIHFEGVTVVREETELRIKLIEEDK